MAQAGTAKGAQLNGFSSRFERASGWCDYGYASGLVELADRVLIIQPVALGSVISSTTDGLNWTPVLQADPPQ
jgi:hypothetical protein